MTTAQDISRLHQSSKTMCDFEDCIRGSFRLGDWASLVQFVTAFVREMASK